MSTEHEIYVAIALVFIAFLSLMIFTDLFYNQSKNNDVGLCPQVNNSYMHVENTSVYYNETLGACIFPGNVSTNYSTGENPT